MWCRLTVWNYRAPVRGALCSAALCSYRITLLRAVRQGEVCLKFLLLGGGQGGEMFPLETAQQESPGDKVPAVRGVLPVGHQAHVLPLAVTDQHDPLGQVAPGLNGAAHDLLKGFQRVLRLGRVRGFAGFHHQNVDFFCHTMSSVSCYIPAASWARS